MVRAWDAVESIQGAPGLVGWLTGLKMGQEARPWGP